MDGKFHIKDAGFNVGVNVKITKRDKKTGRVLETREGHNRCLRMTLMGIAKYLNGEFNDTNYLILSDWIPRYLGIGTNIATVDSDAGITSEVSINDARLLNEISPRIKLPDKNTVVNRSSQSYVQIIISTYLPESYYNGQIIREAGLFSKPTGNNCLFRIVFDDIKKDTDSVVEVNWTISLISIDSENQPYEEYSKADLRESINEVVEQLGVLYPGFEKYVEDTKASIFEYGRSDSTEESIKAATDKMTAAYSALRVMDPTSIPDTISDTIDEINGEII